MDDGVERVKIWVAVESAEDEILLKMECELVSLF